MLHLGGGCHPGGRHHRCLEYEQKSGESSEGYWFVQYCLSFCRVLLWGGSHFGVISAYEVVRLKNGGNIVNVLFRWEVSADGVATGSVFWGLLHETSYLR